MFVFLYGPSKARDRRKFESYNAEVIELPKLRDRKETRFLLPFFQKFEALRHLDSDRVLFVLLTLGSLKTPLSFSSFLRVKIFTPEKSTGPGPELGVSVVSGNCVMAPQIIRKKFKAISLMLDFKPQPIFNTGVMIFNRGFGHKVGAKISEMNELAKIFADKPAYFPSESLHLMDEVVSSIIFGRLKKFSYGIIPKKISPWYCEWKAGVIRDPGIVLHAWTKYSPFFVRDFVGETEVRRLPFIIPVEKEYSEV